MDYREGLFSSRLIRISILKARRTARRCPIWAMVWRRARALSLSPAISERERRRRSEEHTSELQSLMRISYAVFCLKKKKQQRNEEQTIKNSRQEILENDKRTKYQD